MTDCLSDGTPPETCQTVCSTNNFCMTNCLADGTPPETCQSVCGGSSGTGTGGSNATGGTRIGNVQLPNFLTANSISELITNVSQWLINVIGIPLAVFMIVLAGFRFVTAQGNEEKINKAKKNFVWTAVGIGVIFAANMLIIYIQELLGGNQGNTLANFINRIKGTLNLFIGVLFALVTVYFIWGVIQYVTSGGDEKKLAQGKKHMVWGIIGMTIMGAAWGIVTMIRNYVINP